ncbi:hypothetical protein CEXT_380321 [Caerostris extrusa]|uniref:Uncharacterized protein n=1 Tax=Caerostris extrusa TaxID=172846 RepID=A0AAV4P3N7_CAEEX|nr:hypothetical protein CEXT_380321 [Caerostris extrusa]
MSGESSDDSCLDVEVLMQRKNEEPSVSDFDDEYFENADKPRRQAIIVECRKCKLPSSFFDASIYYPPNSEKTKTDHEKKASVSDSNNSDLANKSIPEKA